MAFTLIACCVPLLGFLHFTWRVEDPRRHLTTVAEDIARELTIEGDRIRLKPSPPTAFWVFGPSDAQFVALDAKGAVIAGSPDLAAAIFPEALADGRPAIFYERPHPGSGVMVHGASFRQSVGDQAVFLQFLRPSRSPPMWHSLERFLSRYWQPMILFASLLVILNVLTIRGALAPLRTVSRQAEQIGPATADRRLDQTGLARELLPLVGAVNSAVDRLQAGLRAQREFTADAAHELRTPLAVLAAHVDELADRAAARRLQADIERTARIVDQLLRLSELDQARISPGAQLDLGWLAREVAATLFPLATRLGKDIEVIAPERPVMAQGDAEMLRHAVSNLVENAIRHAVPGRLVQITVADDAGPVVRVGDDGPGIPEADRERVFQRFWRGDRRTGGSGLGLAIVQRVARANHAELAVATSPLGGSEIALFLMPPAVGAPWRPERSARAAPPRGAPRSLSPSRLQASGNKAPRSPAA